MTLNLDRAAEQALDEAVMADILGASAEAPDAKPENDQPTVTVEPVPPAQEAAPAAPDAKPEQAVTPAPEVPPSAAEKGYKFKHRGQEVEIKLTPEQELEYISKGHDYTAKTMELADFRRYAEDVISKTEARAKEQAQAVIALLNDPEKLEAIAAAKRAALGQPPSPPAPSTPDDPDDFISKTQFQALLKEEMGKMEAKIRAEVERGKGSVKEDLEWARQRDSYKNDFDSHLNSLLKEKFPILSEFGDEDVADKIRLDAHKFTQAFITLNPGVTIDPAQVKSVMVDSAKRRAEAIEGKLREREKKNALSRATLVEKGPEPKGGGAAPAPPAKSFSLKDPALDAQVLREIESIMGKGA